MDKCIKDHRKKLSQKLSNLRSTNSRDYWEILNASSYNKKCSVDIDDMYNFLKNINEDTDSDDHVHTIEVDSFNCENSTNDTFLNCEISENEIETAVKKLKNGKAAGYDLIVNGHISNSLSIFLPVYKKLFNLIFDSGFVPEEWLIGVVKPIYKNKGDPTQPENYRPISLLSCLGKVFTSILSNRLELYAEEVCLIKENQTGFRKSYSTLDHILTLQFLSNFLLKKKEETVLCIYRL